jgi:hypothetical protein
MPKLVGRMVTSFPNARQRKGHGSQILKSQCFSASEPYHYGRCMFESETALWERSPTPPSASCVSCRFKSFSPPWCETARGQGVHRAKPLWILYAARSLGHTARSSEPRGRAGRISRGRREKGRPISVSRVQNLVGCVVTIGTSSTLSTCFPTEWHVKLNT